MVRLLWVTLLFTVGCASTVRTLTILHTNDIHGHFAPERATWRTDSALVGGFAALSGALDSVRLRDATTLYLDAGDLMTGNPICNMEVDGVTGGALIEMLRMCSCDAATVGNHEFDLGSTHLREFVATEKVDWLCGNVSWSVDSLALCRPYKIVERKGLRIGIIGLILTDLAGVTSKQASEDFEVGNIIETAQKLIDEVDPMTDLIILLTHNGVENDKQIARSVTNLDIIVGGHSHTRLSEPITENGILIVQAGSYLKHLGVLKVDVKHDQVSQHSGQLVELELARFTPDRSVEMYCASFEAEINRDYGEVIATAEASLDRRYAETSPLGNFLSDLLREHFLADFAIINSGGLRMDISKGDVRKLDIVEMLPFVNSITLFEATGNELLELAKRQAQAQISGKNEILQMSGMVIRYTNENDEPHDIRIEINGLQINSEKTYRGVSIDYVLKSQADKYLGFAPRNIEETGILFSDLVIKAMAELPVPIVPNVEIRLLQETK